MDELLEVFKTESLFIVGEIIEILEELEGNYASRKRLEDVGQRVDRIMGTAKTMFQDHPGELFGMISSYCEICKVVSYRGSQVENDEALFSIVVALLLDTFEDLQRLFKALSTPNESAFQPRISQTFLDRLKWVGEKFDQSLRGTLASPTDRQTQTQIDELLRRLGVK